ncbi:MAG: dCTP deaminase [Promethearchaeota archaeon]
MRFLKTEELEESWKSLIYPPKQLGDVTLDLTVKKILRFKNQGVLDFGGSEYHPADLEPLLPKIEDDPKYGWWNLSKGGYFVEYNETLPKTNNLVLIYPHQRLLMTGCFQIPFIFRYSDDSKAIQGLLVVNKEGVRIKENARISTAITILID